LRRLDVLTVEWRPSPRRPHLIAAEFIVDGRSLREHCERATGRSFDLVSPLGWTLPDHQLAFAERLLLRRPPLLSTGRREFLVCPECADLGCGCISAIVHAEDGYDIWSEFGWENDYDPDSFSLFRMGRFVFPTGSVRRALAGYVPGLSPSTG
jgi:hypothetical protein